MRGGAARARLLPPLLSPPIPVAAAAAARRQGRAAGARFLPPLFSPPIPAAARRQGGALATSTTTVTTEGLVNNDGVRWTATSGSGTTSSIHRATSISAPSHLFALPRLAPPAREGRWRVDLPPPVLGSDGGA
uniref:Uncharacterized protein n=1 Tax=Oryza glumipatula TaxID=40148 RepID=A0A0D9ZIL4_9ORYZ